MFNDLTTLQQALRKYQKSGKPLRLLLPQASRHLSQQKSNNLAKAAAGKCYEFSGEEEEAFGELAKSMDEAATGYLWLVAHAIATGAVLLWTREVRVGPWLRALADGLNDYVLAMLIYGGSRNFQRISESSGSDMEYLLAGMSDVSVLYQQLGGVLVVKAIVSLTTTAATWANMGMVVSVLLALLALLRVLDIVVGAPNLEGSSTRASLLRRALEPLRIIQANFALTDDPSASELSAIVERIKAARAAPGAGEGRGGVLAAGAPPGASREGSSSMGVAGTAGPDGQEAGDRARRTRESSQASQGSPALGVKGAPPLSDGDSQLIEGWLEKVTQEQQEFEFSKDQERFFKELIGNLRRAEAGYSLIGMTGALNVLVQVLQLDLINAVGAIMTVRASWNKRMALRELAARILVVVEEEGSDVTALIQAVGKTKGMTMSAQFKKFSRACSMAFRAKSISLIPVIARSVHFNLLRTLPPYLGPLGPPLVYLRKLLNDKRVIRYVLVCKTFANTFLALKI